MNQNIFKILTFYLKKIYTKYTQCTFQPRTKTMKKRLFSFKMRGFKNKIEEKGVEI